MVFQLGAARWLLALGASRDKGMACSRPCAGRQFSVCEQRASRSTPLTSTGVPGALAVAGPAPTELVAATVT